MTFKTVCDLFATRWAAYQLPLVGDLEQQLALPKVLGFNGKRFRFLGALMIFIGGHDRHSTGTPNGGLIRWDPVQVGAGK